MPPTTSCTLRQFLDDGFGWQESEGFEEHIHCIADEFHDDQVFSDFLSNTYVCLRGSKTSYSAASYSSDLEYLSFEQFIEYLLGASSLNLPSFHEVRSIHLENPDNLRIEDLKGQYWRRFCNLIGRKRFMELVLKSRGFLTLSSGLYHDLDVKLLQYSADDETVFLKSNMMYRGASSSRTEEWENLFSNSGLDKLSRHGFEHMRFSNSRLRKFKKMMSRIKRQTHMTFYYIFKNKLSKYGKFQDLTLPFHLIFEFCQACLKKSFGPFVLGNQKNDKILSWYLRNYLSSGKRMRVHKEELLHRIDKEKVPWLHYSHKYSTSQEKAFDKDMLFNFIAWLFQDFICKIVSQFCYVTEAAHLMKLPKQELLFILHEDWKLISEPWIERYKELYLEKFTEVSSREGGLNHGTLRAIPKKDEFRPLRIPDKRGYLERDGRRVKKDQEFRQYDRFVIRPARSMIRFFQELKLSLPKNNTPKCTSVNDVICALNNFRSQLPDETCSVSAVKFDMKHCFDNLNQSHIVNCINEFLEELDDNEFFLEEFLNHSTSRSTVFKLLHSIKTKKTVSTSRKINPLNRRYPKKLISMSRIIKIKKSDIVELVNEQILNATVTIPGDRNTYKRKRGVFQGSPLLGIFCDIVYDRLIHKCFRTMLRRGRSTLIRLADDFLFISTEERDCREMLRYANSQYAHNAGAYVNSEKSQLFLASLHPGGFVIEFVGLRIKCPTLGVSLGMSPTLRPPLKASRSQQYYFKYLLWVFESRLPKESIGVRSHTGDLIKQSIIKASSQIMYKFRSELLKNLTKASDALCFLLSMEWSLINKVRRYSTSARDVAFAIDCFEKNAISILKHDFSSRFEDFKQS